jgi:hypothetical protein
MDENQLTCRTLADLATALASAADAATAERLWSEARAVWTETAETDEAMTAALAAKDTAALGRITGEWLRGAHRLPERDQAIVKRAMKAYRKRLKLTQLDVDSTIGGRGLSSGSRGQIVAIQPPNQYPPVVWETLAGLGRLKSAGHGLYEAPRE